MKNDENRCRSIGRRCEALSACGTPLPYRAADGTEAPKELIAQCEYEASKATAGIRSGLEAGFEKATLQDKCMRVKGYERR